MWVLFSVKKMNILKLVNINNNCKYERRQQQRTFVVIRKAHIGTAVGTNIKRGKLTKE
jgi:hypothetical protein